MRGMSQLSRIHRLHALLIMAAGYAILILGIVQFAIHGHAEEYTWWFRWGVIGAGAGMFLSFSVRGAITGTCILLAVLIAMLWYSGALSR